MSTTMQNFRRFDAWICLKVFGWNRHKYVDRLMTAASRLGDGYAYGFIGLIIFFLDKAAGRILLPSAAIAFSAMIALQTTVKHLARRARPYITLPQIQNRIHIPDRYSFPSGHAANAFVMASLLQFFYPAIAVPLYLGASAIGLSRVYKGVHYPTDVLAGSLMGIGCARLGLAIMM